MAKTYSLTHMRQLDNFWEKFIEQSNPLEFKFATLSYEYVFMNKMFFLRQKKEKL